MPDAPETGRGAAFKMNRDRACVLGIEAKRRARFLGDFAMHSQRHTMHTRLGEYRAETMLPTALTRAIAEGHGRACSSTVRAGDS